MNIKINPETFLLGLLDKEKQKIWNFVVCADSSENALCKKLEKQTSSHKGRISGKTDELAEMAKLIALIKEKNTFNFVSTQKPLLDFSDKK